MNSIASTSRKNQPFEDKILDNEGFFQAMEEGLPLVLSVSEIQNQTRLELQELFTHMKKQKFIRWVTEWTANEQKNFFETVQKEILNVGTLASLQIREKIQTLIEDEIWREINDDGEKYSLMDGDGNTMIPSMGEYQKFLDTSFLLSRETTTIPLDLRLTINEESIIEDAQKKLRRYHGKYNSLVLVDNEDHPMGIIRADMLRKYESEGHRTLVGIPRIEDVVGYYTTTSEEAKETMQRHGINILPIIDSNTKILIGILTNALIEKKDIQQYYTTSLTKLNLEVWMKM